MDINKAKEYIKDSVRLYLTKDEFGDYKIPVVRQRPIFLLGAPGIGKTAIMEQIAQEMGIALVSYSMTHHTRQSALGLPFISHKTYAGEEVAVSEYTMSEIIASIYETMNASGISEGILFLDEINCVSETLAPAMLQFLQYKVFGRHSVPEGWVIVTAGNPPEYNKSVREFDVVTYDRLKVLEVEADYNTWRNYAMSRGVSSAVLSYLDLKREHFYVMQMTEKGRSYVTARGWEDLSGMLTMYEAEGLTVDETLISQYLRSDEVVKEFIVYYELFNKYKRDYRISEILDGNPPAEAISRARKAAFDERLSLLGMLLDRVTADIRGVMKQSAFITELLPMLKAVKAKSNESPETIRNLIDTLAAQVVKKRTSLISAGALSDDERKISKQLELFLTQLSRDFNTNDFSDGPEAFAYVKEKYDASVKLLRDDATKAGKKLHALFVFSEEAFDGGNEMLVLVSQLTAGDETAKYLATFGSEDYAKHSRDLMITERNDALREQILELNLD